MRRMLVALIFMGVAASAWAAAPLEYRYLDGVGDPKRWSPAECETSVSPHAVWEHPALRRTTAVTLTSSPWQKETL